MKTLPDMVTTEAELDNLLSSPQERVVSMLSRLAGDIVVLGVGGKMGVSLAIMAKRACNLVGDTRKVIGVSRFSDTEARQKLEGAGVETIACDLLDSTAVSMLPRSPNIIFMAGRKFGTGGDAELTWAMNAIVPSHVCKHYQESRIVAFSTGCVYPFVDHVSGGSREGDAPNPIGEYAQSCLARERVFQYYCNKNKTPVCLIRLNYAIDLRYGVLHDLATLIHNDHPIDLSMAHFNMIWQGDANAIALLQLENCTVPANVINLTGPEIHSTKAVSLRLAEAMSRSPRFAGTPRDSCYLSNARTTLEKFGGLTVDADTLIRWNAHWVSGGGRSLNKPTHFEVNDGRY